MKRDGNLYSQLCDKDRCRQAILQAAKGKHSRPEVKRVIDNIDSYAEKLQTIMQTESYVPTPYKVFDRYDPHSKKTRKIQRPKFFPDQAIHWLIVGAMQPTIMRGMYYWSCGSIPGRGGKHGQKYIKNCLKDRKNTKYCLKLDIRHFYDSVPHDKLKASLRRKIKDKQLLNLLDKVIDTTGVGIPIGNYTSQWLANFYLEELDHYIKERLHVKYYVRYVDDMVLFSGNKKKLHNVRRKLFAYIENKLGLEVKGDWQVYKTDSCGVDFLGFVFHRGYVKMRSRNYLAFVRQCRRTLKRIRQKKRIPYITAAGLLSRVGQLKHCNGQNVRRKYFDPIGMARLKAVIKNHGKQRRIKNDLHYRHT